MDRRFAYPRTRTVPYGNPLGMIELPRMPIGEYVLSLDGDPSWEVIEPGFTIREGKFTMPVFVTRRREGR